MDDSLEHPDDGLRYRIRKGFEDNANRKSKKIEERPKTPRNSKTKGKVTISNQPETISVDENQAEITEKPKTVPVKKVVKKAVVRKPKPVVAERVKKAALKKITPPAKASTKKPTPAKKTITVPVVYLCPKCDKTYKSKNGIVKHMGKCK